MKVELSKTRTAVECYDFIEFELKVTNPKFNNPFTEVKIKGEFRSDKGKKNLVEGFCDSDDGSIYKLRFMPKNPGKYEYFIKFLHHEEKEKTITGSIRAEKSNRKGILRADPDNPYHFKWEGTEEHYFLNGTTTYYLMGWEDEQQIKNIIDRLDSYKINRLRVLVYGREFDNPWGTPVINCDEFNMTLNPWSAKFPQDITVPEFDMSRFNVTYWQKYERMLEYARKKDIIISVIFFIGAQPLCVPFNELSEDEYRYYRYGVNRLSAFSNITWDVGNEHDFHRDEMWTRNMCNYIRKKDPYDHMITAHNKIYRENFIDMQLIQNWDAGLYDVIIDEKAKLAKNNLQFPQVIEEYGYEDLWEDIPGMRSAETRRRCAWEIYMAGGYQTTGESARNGTGTGKDTGGGWVNGRGDEDMAMLEGYKIIYDFFTSLEWWKLEPASDEVIEAYYNFSFYDFKYYRSSGERVTYGKALCLANKGKTYIFYLPAGGNIKVSIKENIYSIKRLQPRSGQMIEIGETRGEAWESPDVGDKKDWVFLLQQK